MKASETAVDRLYRENRDLLNLLTEAREASLINSTEENFRKTLLLAAASLFEVQIREALVDFVSEKSGGHEAIIAFFKSKAIDRQYHTYFDWRERTANRFWSFFGSNFREYMLSVVRPDSKLKQSIAAFLEIGELRNNLVHQDFASFPLEKTAEEIYELYKLAQYFVQVLPEQLRQFETGVSGK